MRNTKIQNNRFYELFNVKITFIYKDNFTNKTI